MSRLNILFLNQAGHIAGSTLSILYLARGLAALNHKIYVGCRPFSVQSMLLSDSDVKVVHFSIRHALDPSALRIIRDTVEKESIDVVNAQSSLDRNGSIYSRFLYRWPAVLVHTRRQMPASAGGKLQSWFYTRGTDAVIAVCNEVKNALVKKGIPDAHIRVIYNGTPVEKYEHVDPVRIAELRKRYGINPDTRVIGCVARPHKQETHRQLLEALKVVGIPSTLLFVGTQMRREYTELIESISRRHRVHFCGLVPPHDALNHFGLFDLFVLPSVSEGISQSILEAMAMGVPVIVAGAGGNIDLVRDGENGILVENNDILGLAEKIQRVLSDPDRFRRMCVRAKQTALETFSIEKTIREYERCFHSLVRART